MPPPLLPTEEDAQDTLEVPALRLWVRGGLVTVAAGLVAVFAIAIWLNPYKNGQVWLQETHRQIGLPPCTFKYLTGLPCPSCGMTSSFSLLMHGDLWNSLRANFVGTILALFLLPLIPWSLACAVRGKMLLVQSVEPILVRVVVWFLILLMLRWAVVLLLEFLTGQGIV